MMKRRRTIERKPGKEFAGGAECLNAAGRAGSLRGMKCNLAAAGLLALGAGMMAPAARAGNSLPLPTPYPESRYQEMSARSPFAVSTASAAPAATPDFAAQLYVDGVAHIGETDYVAIKSRDPDKAEAVFLAVGEKAEDGMKVERVDWSDEMGHSRVEVSKGGERATLSFDQAEMAKAASTMTAGLPPSRRNLWQQPTLEENNGPEAIIARFRGQR